MNKGLNLGGRVRRRFRLAAVAITILTVGCARYRVVEIDTTTARDFSWTGRVRLTQRTTEEMNLYGPRRQRTEIRRIELLGEGDRNVVIRPLEHLRGDKPYACVQDVGSPPDQYLVPLRQRIPEYRRAWESVRAFEKMLEEKRRASERTSEDKAAESDRVSEALRKAWEEAFSEYLRVSSHIQRREFEKVGGAELAFACPFRARQRESTYQLDEHTVVRVRIEDGSLLTVTVEDQDGNVLHRYAPEELAVTEVEDP